MNADPVPGARVCYLSVDGMTDPLGRSQVLPYLAGLSAKGHDISILSLEKPERFAAGKDAVAAICETAGIVWHPLPYRRRPPLLSGYWNVARLSRRAIALHRRRPFDIVHGRSDLASLAGARLWRHGGARFLYDMRALWPDERVEGGAWPQSNPLYRLIFRLFKRHQKAFLDEASAIVTLTKQGKELVDNWPGRRGKAPVTVIPCCASYDAFRPADPQKRAAARDALHLGEDQKALIYLGSIGSWYMLPEMLDFAAAYRDRHPNARLLIVTPDVPAPILREAESRGLQDCVIVRSARREEVPDYLAAADLGLFFIMPVFSKRVSSPTKLGEMLACGLPVVTNSGVGDVAEIVAEAGGGVAIDRFDRSAYDAAIDTVDAAATDPLAIRARSRRWFDVETGIDAYDGIYRYLLNDTAKA